MTKFCIQAQGTCSREQIAIIQASRILGYEYHFAQTCPEGEIPIGDIPFCEAVFGKQPDIKDFYPHFLSDMKRRIIYGPLLKSWIKNPVGKFVKSATQWKSDFQSRIITEEDEIPDDVYYVSDPIPGKIFNEWRVYVANGKPVTSGWYSGQDEDKPLIDISSWWYPRVMWPKNFSAAIDVAEMELPWATGCTVPVLVEVQAPFACGFYGDDPVLYAKWQVEAWNNADYWKARRDAR